MVVVEGGHYQVLSGVSAVGRTPFSPPAPSLGDAAAGVVNTTPRGPMDELMEAMLLPLRPAPTSFWWLEPVITRPHRQEV